MDGPGNQCVSGRRKRRCCSSTTSPKASSKVKSSVPSLFFNSRQREGKFFKQRCGEKGTTSRTSVSGPCGTNVSLSLFQALRVRERLGESSRVCVDVRNSVLQSGSRDAGSLVPGAASVGIEGGCGPPLRVNSAVGGVGDFSELPRVNSADGGDFSEHSTASTGGRGRAPCPAENTLALPSASACALAACTHGSCSAPSSAVVHACW